MRMFVWLLLAWSCSASAAELSDANAAAIAKKMANTVAAKRNVLNELIQRGEREHYQPTVAVPVRQLLEGWPEQKLDNRAIFPYHACRQAAVSLLQYGDAWAINDASRTWRDRVKQSFLADARACDSSIRKPDLSLKTLQ